LIFLAKGPPRLESFSANSFFQNHVPFASALRLGFCFTKTSIITNKAKDHAKAPKIISLEIPENLHHLDTILTATTVAATCWGASVNKAKISSYPDWTK